MPVKIIAQIFGLCAMVALFSIYQQTDRRKLIRSKLFADAFWVVHYVMLGAYGGAIPNFVGILREFIFINREKKKWANLIVWPILFVAFNWLLGYFTFSSPINIMPIAASTLVTISLWNRNPNITKILSIPVSMTFMVYDFFVGSWVGIANESLAIVSIIIYFIKAKKNKGRVDHEENNIQ